eukprot:555832-Pelagomonas_calceolata.AAC.1
MSAHVSIRLRNTRSWCSGNIDPFHLDGRISPGFDSQWTQTLVFLHVPNYLCRLPFVAPFNLMLARTNLC